MDEAHSKEVPGYPGYFVDVDGNVWTTKRKGGNDRTAGRRGAPVLLAARRTQDGYVIVGLDRNGHNVNRLVHRLVLEAFVGACPDGMEACHYPDSDKSNNRLTNLRWDTHVENIRDRVRDVPTSITKQCRRCLEIKLREDFYTDKRASDGLQTECKACHTETAARTRDPERKREANREHMRRVRAAAKHVAQSQ